MRNYKKIIARIKSGNSFGTAFLVNNKYAITAAHVIDEGGTTEVELTFFNLPKKIVVKGKALNLQKSLDKNKDAVIIELEEELDILNTPISFVSNNGLPDSIRWASYSYPSLKQHGEPLRGYVNNTISPSVEAKWDIDLFCENQLTSYKGASGSPLIINNKVVGIIIEETNNTLTAISTNKIIEFLQSNSVSVVEEEIKFSYPQELEIIDDSWFAKQINKALYLAQPRYTPKLNVDVPLSKYLSAFSDDNAILQDIENLIEKIGKAIEDWERSVNNEDHWNGKDDFPKIALSQSKEIQEKLRQIELLVSHLFNDENIDLQSVRDQVKGEIENNEEVYQILIEEFDKEHGDGQHKNQNFLQFLHEYQMVFPERHFQHAEANIKVLNEIYEFVQSDIISCYFSINILITGAWGTGKTHSICDFLSNWINHGGYGILLFGEQLGESDLWTSIKQKLDIPQTISNEHLIAKLNNIAGETGKPLLFFIDALNETKQKDFWKDNLKDFLFSFKDYPNIKVALSCRTSYIDKVMRDDFKSEINSIIHEGFSNIEYEASLEFFNFYKIEKPSFPIMNPEFANPLFLRLFCETIEGDNTNLDQGYLSITKLIDAFLTRKNKEISNRHEEILEKEYVIHNILSAFALRAFELKVKDLLWSDAIAIIEELVSDRSLSRKLFEELLKENLIREDRNEKNDDIILFSFERLYEHLVVNKLLEEYNSIEDVEIEFATDGKFNWLVQEHSSVEAYNGIIEAFSIYVAEKFKTELFEITDYNKLILKPTLQGMIWRNNDAFSYSSQSIVKNICLRDRELVELGWLTLIKLSTRIDCKLNSEFLYQILKPLSLPEIDLTWSNVLFDKYKKEQSITRTVNTAINYDLSNLPEKTAVLWAETLLWFCSSNDRRLRDYSTRALTNIIEKVPSISLSLFDRFNTINDDYIFERFTLATYGAFIRNSIGDVIVQFVNKLYETYRFKNKFPHNVLIRDNIRGIAELALSLDIFPDLISIDHFRPPYDSQWPLEIPSDEFIEQYKDTYWELPKLYKSCFDDDFERYTLNHIENYCKHGIGKKIETVDGFSKYDFQKCFRFRIF